MNLKKLNILLADDDTDDRFFFKKVLNELSIAVQLTTVHNGEELMAYLLENSDQLPDLLFLDLNMPRKSGFECLSEINENEKLKVLPVVIFSTFYSRDITYGQGIIKMLSEIGTYEYIRKLEDFAQFKQDIHNALIKAETKRVLK